MAKTHRGMLKKDIKTVERYLKSLERYERNVAKRREKESDVLNKEISEYRSQYLKKNGEMRKRISKQKVEHARQFLSTAKSKAVNRQNIRKKIRKSLAEHEAIKGQITPDDGLTPAQAQAYAKRVGEQRAEKAIALFTALNKDALLDALLFSSEQVITTAREHTQISADDIAKIAEVMKRDKERKNALIMGGVVTQDDTLEVLDNMLKHMDGIDRETLLQDFPNLTGLVEQYSDQIDSGQMSIMELLEEVNK